MPCDVFVVSEVAVVVVWTDGQQLWWGGQQLCWAGHDAFSFFRRQRQRFTVTVFERFDVDDDDDDDDPSTKVDRLLKKVGLATASAVLSSKVNV